MFDLSSKVTLEFKRPYNDRGKCTFSHKEYKHVGGVYVIMSDKNIIKYVGMSTKRLYDRVYRHFQNYTKHRKNGGKYRFQDTYYNKETHLLALYLCNDPAFLERELIYDLNPKDNRLKLDKVKINTVVKEFYFYQEDYDLIHNFEAEKMLKEWDDDL